jgi:hypothetical protein
MKPNTQYRMLSPTLSSARRIDPAVSHSAKSVQSPPGGKEELTRAEDTGTDHLADVEKQYTSPSDMVAKRRYLFDWRSITVLIYRYSINVDLLADLCVLLGHHHSVDSLVRIIGPEELLDVRNCCHCFSLPSAVTDLYQAVSRL